MDKDTPAHPRLKTVTPSAAPSLSPVKAHHPDPWPRRPCLLPFRVISALSAALLLIASLAPSAGAQADERFFAQTNLRIHDNPFWDTKRSSACAPALGASDAMSNS